MKILIVAFMFGAWWHTFASDLVAADQSTHSRFTLVMNGAAVKDNKTGLIWEQEPDREQDLWSRSNGLCD